jgi:hypothetical protein
MAYTGTVRRLLVSGPSDITDADLDAVAAAVGRWNAVYGPAYATAIVPLSWRHHAVAEYGEPAQDLLNDQLVDQADIVVALFWTRLGSPTSNAVSGTAEEIERAAAGRKNVAVLHCGRPMPTDVDLSEVGRLRTFLTDVRSRALLLSYHDEAELQRHVENILARFVTKDQTLAQVAASEPAVAVADVWPRVESRPVLRFGRESADFYLVLENRGTAVAEDVTFWLDQPTGSGPEHSVLPEVLNVAPIKKLAPGSIFSFPLVVFFGVTPSIECTVAWKDARGERENSASLSLF